MSAARRDAGLTQVELARAARVSQQLISALENDRYDGTANLVGIAQALGVRSEWLETGQGARQEDRKASPPKVDASIDAIRFALASLFSLTAVARPRAALEIATSMRRLAKPDVLRDPFLQDVLSILDSAAKKGRNRG